MPASECLISDWDAQASSALTNEASVVMAWQTICSYLGMEAQNVLKAHNHAPTPISLSRTFVLRLRTDGVSRETVVGAFKECMLLSAAKELPMSEPSGYVPAEVELVAKKAAMNWERIAQYCRIDPNEIKQEVPVGDTMDNLSRTFWQQAKEAQKTSADVVAALQRAHLNAYVSKVPGYPWDSASAPSPSGPAVPGPSVLASSAPGNVTPAGGSSAERPAPAVASGHVISKVPPEVTPAATPISVESVLGPELTVPEIQELFDQTNVTLETYLSTVVTQGIIQAVLQSWLGRRYCGSVLIYPLHIQTLE
eukprot:TRINITY_DN3930_c0_g1_i3.p1 TRINITY_DN3930_c0_g1~~TRINITY_DN3930_c0_g1_i3.p1  ORF type:complete len:333 (+),score=-6.56 TRINITY_DN3930_c0_g1_i3:75-1001(+)